MSALAALLALLPAADDADGEGLNRLPVVELTAFKDGHALVRREGTLPVTDGTARVDGLPAPLLGTFWPYSPDEQIELLSATAGKQAVEVTRTPLTAEELLTAGVGRRITVWEWRGETEVSYEATILGRTTRTPAEQAGNAPDAADPPVPQLGPVILLRTDRGTRVVPVDAIREFTFLDGPAPDTLAETVVRTGLRLRLDTEKPEAAAGLMYVQRGFRWIPQYRVDLGESDDDGSTDAGGDAELTLQAALVNDLIDLDDATVRLVVGVPTFPFAGQVDPIALRAVAENVTRTGRTDGRGRSPSLSNAFQSQVAVDFAEMPEESPAPVGVTGGGRPEDLYVFTLEHVTLRKGERMTVRVGSWTVPYEDRFAIRFPVVPPGELLRNVDAERRAEVGRRLALNTVSHAVRLRNTTDVPLTTSPALLFRDGQILAQSLLPYAAPGGSTELDLGTAVEVSARITEDVTGRTPEPKLRDERFERVSLAGRITLTNRRPGPTTVRVVRLVPGEFDTPGTGDGEDAAAGSSRTLGLADLATEADDVGTLLSRYGVPNWWASLNPTSEAVWTVTVPPGGSQELPHTWHYFWRW